MVPTVPFTTFNHIELYIQVGTYITKIKIKGLLLGIEKFNNFPLILIRLWVLVSLLLKKIPQVFMNTDLKRRFVDNT